MLIARVGENIAKRRNSWHIGSVVAVDVKVEGNFNYNSRRLRKHCRRSPSCSDIGLRSVFSASVCEADVFFRKGGKLGDKVVGYLTARIRVGKGVLHRFKEDIDKMPLLLGEVYFGIVGIYVMGFNKVGLYKGVCDKSVNAKAEYEY